MQIFNTKISGRQYRVEVMDSNTVPPKDIAKTIGHAFTSTTFDDYSQSVLARAAELQAEKENHNER